MNMPGGGEREGEGEGERERERERKTSHEKQPSWCQGLLWTVAAHSLCLVAARLEVVME